MDRLRAPRTWSRRRRSVDREFAQQVRRRRELRDLGDARVVDRVARRSRAAGGGLVAMGGGGRARRRSWQVKFARKQDITAERPSPCTAGSPPCCGARWHACNSRGRRGRRNRCLARYGYRRLAFEVASARDPRAATTRSIDLSGDSHEQAARTRRGRRALCAGALGATAKAADPKRRAEPRRPIRSRTR